MTRASFTIAAIAFLSSAAAASSPPPITQRFAKVGTYRSSCGLIQFDSNQNKDRISTAGQQNSNKEITT